MMMIAASEFTTPIGLAAWLGCAAFVVALINGGFKLARNVKGTEPHPANSTLDERVGTLSRDVDRIDKDVRRVDEDVKGLRRDIGANGEVRKAAMIDHIDKVRLELDKKIQSVSDRQTENLIRALKGKND